jgi:23S rRNA (adenine-N6)-dimethyltransferase
VIAFETDKRRYLECKEKFINQDRFELYLDDFLIWEIPPQQRYKVFSNIPFSHTADIINKLLHGTNPPEDCYLIIQKEAAEKYAGFPVDTLASLLIKPLFWADIIYHFNRNDFRPVPSVDIALLHIEQRASNLIPEWQYELYRNFVIFLRQGKNRTIKKAFKQMFTYTQQKRLSKILNIDFRSSPTSLSFVQYLGIFQFYLDCSKKSTPLTNGMENKQRKQHKERNQKRRAGR